MLDPLWCWCSGLTCFITWKKYVQSNRDESSFDAAVLKIIRSERLFGITFRILLILKGEFMSYYSFTVK